MDTIADLHRQAHMIEQALEDLDAEEQMAGADLVIESLREVL